MFIYKQIYSVEQQLLTLLAVVHLWWGWEQWRNHGECGSRSQLHRLPLLLAVISLAISMHVGWFSLFPFLLCPLPSMHCRSWGGEKACFLRALFACPSYRCYHWTVGVVMGPGIGSCLEGLAWEKGGYCLLPRQGDNNDLVTANCWL